MRLFMRVLGHLVFVLVCTQLAACFRQNLPDVIFRKIEEHGGPQIKHTQGSFEVEQYELHEDADGFQIYSPGNHVSKYLATFQPHFGTPVLLKTNASGVVFFMYSGNQAGLNISCSLDPVEKTGDQFTHLLVVKPEAIP